MDNHVGFTGSRKGMTMQQIDSVTGILLALKRRNSTNWFHHGKCVGSDEEAHEIALKLSYLVHVHPPEITTYEAVCNGWAKRSPMKDYRERNRDIVRAVGVLIVVPANHNTRSGTWMTYGIARKLDVPRIVVSPDGRVDYSEYEQ